MRFEVDCNKVTVIAGFDIEENIHLIKQDGKHNFD
jgi:hypothetical protein